MLAETFSPSCSDYLAGADDHYTNKNDARMSYIGCNHFRQTMLKQLRFQNDLNIVAVNACAEEILSVITYMQKRLKNY